MLTSALVWVEWSWGWAWQNVRRNRVRNNNCKTGSNESNGKNESNDNSNHNSERYEKQFSNSMKSSNYRNHDNYDNNINNMIEISCFAHHSHHHSSTENQESPPVRRFYKLYAQGVTWVENGSHYKETIFFYHLWFLEQNAKMRAKDSKQHLKFFSFIRKWIQPSKKVRTMT